MPQDTYSNARREAVRQSWDEAMSSPAGQRELETARDELAWFMEHPDTIPAVD